MALTAFLTVSSKTELKTYFGTAQGQPIWVLDANGEVFVFDYTSTATPNDVTVLLPNELTVSDPGRYLSTYGLFPAQPMKLAGTTNSSGLFSVTYPTPLAVAPQINPVLIGGSDTQLLRVVSNTATGFSILVRNRVDVLGLLPTYNNVNGATVEVTVFR